MATRSAKPNGFRVIDSSVISVQDFLDPLPVGDLPGVGSSTRRKLQATGFSLCQHVRCSSVETLQTLLGQVLGAKLHRICCGVDLSPADVECLNCSEGSRDKDSIGVQMSWGVRLASIPHVHIFFRCLAEELCSRASKAGVRGSTLTLKLWIRSEGAPEAAKHMGHGICYQISKSGSIPLSCADVAVDDIMPTVVACFEKCRATARSLTAEHIRGVGITMSRLQAGRATSEPQQPTCARLPLAQTAHQPTIAFAPVLKSPPPKNPFCAQVPVAASVTSPSKPVHPLPAVVVHDVVAVPAPAQKRRWCQPAISSSQLDHNVLAALPPELRRQVQDDAEQVSALKRRNNEFNRRSGFDAVPVQGRDRDAACPVSEAPSLRALAAASTTGNAGLEHVLQMKRSVAAWMAVGPPKAEDVRLVGAIIRSLAAARRFDALRSFLLALARCAHGIEGCERQRVWVEWVGRAIEFAQKKVLARHGAVLCLS
jgi:hypothetical protein